MTTQANQNQTKPKIPKLRFGEFRENWEEKKLGEVFKLQSGNSFKSDLFEKNGIPIVRISNISNKNNYMDMTNLVYYKKIENDSNFLINKNDLLIAMSGATTGKVSIYNLEEKSYLNQRVGLFRNLNKNVLHYKFLTQFIFSNLFFKQIRKVLVAGAQPNISSKDIENFKISLPSLPEQEKIAKFLSKVDEEIENLKSQKETLEKHKRGLMQKIFSRKIRFTDEGGSEFADWEEKRLGEVIKLQSGNSFKSDLFEKNGIPIVRISNISNKNNYMDMTNLVYYKKIENDSNFLINKNDLLIAMSGATTGKVSIYNLEEKSYLNQRVGLFRNLNKNVLHYKFLTQFIFSNLFFKQIRKVLVAGAQPNISSKDIENFKISLPSLPEQEKIAKFLSKIDETIECKQTEISTAEKWKKGLMGRMFC